MIVSDSGPSTSERLRPQSLTLPESNQLDSSENSTAPLDDQTSTENQYNFTVIKKKNSLPSIDQAFVKVPYECAVRLFLKFQREIEKDIVMVSRYIEEKLSFEKVSNCEGDICDDVGTQIKKLDKLVKKLEAVKAKIDKGFSESDAYLRMTQKRFRKLGTERDIQTLHMTDDFSYDEYKDRIGWILFEYLKRKGFTRTADKFCSVNHLDDYVDKEIYDCINNVTMGLKNHDTKVALAWCRENNYKLKKHELFFEAELHLQNAIQLLIENKPLDAVNYIKKNISMKDIDGCPDVKKFLTLCALEVEPPDCYNFMLSDERWGYLIKKYQEAYAEVYGLPGRTSLELLLQAGFSVVKSKTCNEFKSASCPTCQPELMEYLSKIPSPHKRRSFLICPITGEIMDDNNPALVSPDGYVYSLEGLRSLEDSFSKNTIRCPRSKLKYTLSQFKKIYVN